MPTSELPASARVVIIGGGVMGCGLAYHLTQEGWSDVVLLEKAELTSGSTWHAAGQITHSTSSFSLGKCVDYNIGLYSGELERETGQSVSWHGCGSFRIAYTPDEMDWLRHTLCVATALGFNIELVEPQRIRELHPFYNVDGVSGALYTPDDGHVDPSGVTHALAAGAKMRGAKIIRHCRATDITLLESGEWKVHTAHGDIVCEHVVNAGGTYARQMGEWNGLQLPMTSMTHHYFVTDTVAEFEALDRELPVIRDDKQVSGYVRMEQKSGLIGIYEKSSPNTVWEDHCPWDAEHELFAPDYDRVMPWLENALQRMPVLADYGIKRDVHGAISHPPDGNPLTGPAPGVTNYWCCCGCQIGIGWGPGLTRELARWMVYGAADISMRDYDPRRFGDYADKKWQVVKAREDYCLRHEIPFPHFNRLAGRPVKAGPLYQRLKNQGAVFEEVFGHERPRWFATDGIEAMDQYSFKRNEVHDIVGREVAAVRTAAGIMDVTAFAKVEVAGADAEVYLDRLVANRLPRNTGSVVLAHFLNERGRIEIESTIVKLEEQRYYIVCAAFFEQRLLDHLQRYTHHHCVEIINRSSSWSAVTLQGPHAQVILASVTNTSLDIQGFRWLTAQTIEIAGASVLAVRMSYSGEAGWEIHGPGELMLQVYDALWNAGTRHGLVNYGSFAMNVMRMEKGFKGAAELTNEVTLPEADVMRFVSLDKGDFTGRQQTLVSCSADLQWVCRCLEIEPDGISDGHGGEAVLHNNKVVGSVSSMVYGHTVGKGLAFAYIKPDVAIASAKLSVLVMGKPRTARVLLHPAYDPQSLLPRVQTNLKNSL